MPLLQYTQHLQQHYTLTTSYINIVEYIITTLVTNFYFKIPIMHKILDNDTNILK